MLDSGLAVKYQNEIKKRLKNYDTVFDTVYFGGGTPPLLGAERIAALLDEVRGLFSVADNAEVTVEVNPRNVTPSLIRTLRAAGVNRISMGAQSGVASELTLLGRRHSPDDIRRASDIIHDGGIDNLSLDLMLCFPTQTEQSLGQSIELLCACSPTHISAYLFKLEEGTRFFAARDSFDFPDDDVCAQIYLSACELLAERGFAQYEISNFAKSGMESRHNLKYWNVDEYIGFGPAAHSFVDGRRYYYERSLTDYIDGAENGGACAVDDGTGGTSEEYIMLRLRLADGLSEALWHERFGAAIPAQLRSRALPLHNAGLLVCDERGIRLTRQGFLLSNSIICALLD
ncbi:MAG: radical SAM family heme chaperone HemW [Clostridia bacterium]|nr:radical SAM family heme chaperone HemW [Clostridia bacterium]